MHVTVAVLIALSGAAGVPTPMAPSTGSPRAPKLVSMPAEVLRDLIDRTVYAVSKDPSRYNLSGVFFHVRRDELRAVATDGRRMSVSKARVPGVVGEETGVIIPLPDVVRLRQLAQGALDRDGAGARLQFGFSAGLASARLGNVALDIRPIEGMFPDYASAIPSPGPRASVDRSALIAAMTDVERAAAGSPPIARLILRAGSLSVSTAAGNASGGTRLSAAYSGPQVTVHVNPRFVREALEPLADKQVLLDVSGPLAPVSLRLVGSDDFTAVIMPIRL